MMMALETAPSVVISLLHLLVLILGLSYNAIKPVRL